MIQYSSHVCHYCCRVFLTVSGSRKVLVFFWELLHSLWYTGILVAPIGGADMPVVIFFSIPLPVLLRHSEDSCTIQVMLTGILVGSARNSPYACHVYRDESSFVQCNIRAFGETAATTGGGKTGGTIKDISISDAAVLMNYSKKVIIVPGYGLAVAQAQHVIHELEKLLEEQALM